MVYAFHKCDMMRFLGGIGTRSTLPSDGEAVEKIRGIQEDMEWLYPFDWSNETEKVHIQTGRWDINGDEKKVVGISGPYKHPQQGLYYGRIAFMFPDGDILRWDPELPGTEGTDIRERPLSDVKKILRTEGVKGRDKEELEELSKHSAVTINTPPYPQEEVGE